MSTSIRAVYMRGGTSKALFFRAEDLPASKSLRDALLLRVLGMADANFEGMGETNESSSKLVILAPSLRDDADVDVLFGRLNSNVKHGAPIDWSGTCSKLAAAVGPFAIHQGWVAAQEGHSVVRIWQPQCEKHIVAHVPTRAGEVLEVGNFYEDGVGCGNAEIVLEFIDPVTPGKRGLLPMGRTCDTLSVEGFAAPLRVTLLDSGTPMVFVRADALRLNSRLNGHDSIETISKNRKLLASLENIRAQAAVAMHLAASAEAATRLRSGLPQLVWIASPAAYRSTRGIDIEPHSVDLLVRMLPQQTSQSLSAASAIAVACAASLPGSIVAEVTRTLPGVATRIGHAAGVASVSALLEPQGSGWHVSKAVMSCSARRLMEGVVLVPKHS